MMDPISHPTKATSPAWLVSLQLAIILASIALSLFPQVRVAAVVGPFIAGSLVNCALMFRSEWKSGRLSSTPGQLLQRAQAGARFPRQTLGLAASIASCIAQWHVSMG
jgi:hypothetical protein